MSFFIRRFFNRFFGNLSFLSPSRRGSLPFSHTARRKTAKNAEGRVTSPNFKESHFKLFSGEEIKISDMRSAAFLCAVSASLVAYCKRLLLKSRALVSVLAGLISHSFQQGGFIQSAKTTIPRRFRWVAVLMLMGFAGSGVAQETELQKCISSIESTAVADIYGPINLFMDGKSCNDIPPLGEPPDTMSGEEFLQMKTKDKEERDNCNKIIVQIRNQCANLAPKKAGDKSDCEEAVKEFEEAKTEANSKCSRLNSSDITQCMSVMRSCEDCPDEKKGKRCVTLPGRAKCPQLAGTDLEDLKEEIRDSKDAKKDLQQDIKELQDEIVEKQGEIVTAEKEYKEDIHTLQSELQTNQEEMEREVKESQAKIDGGTQKAVDAVKGELSKSLKLQHSFVNGIAKVDRKRREDTAKIHRECRHKASAQLAAYRRYRRKAIREGRYGNKGVRKIMGKARVSFTKQDNIRYRSYHSACLTENADSFKAIEENYQTDMRMIEQQKQQVLAQFQAMQAQVQQLNNRAYQQKNQIVQDFAKNTEKALKKFGANQAQRTQNYKGERGQLGRSLATLNAQLQKKQGELGTVTEQEGLNTAYMQSARQKGASSKSSDGESRVQEAQHALAELRDKIMPAYTKCCAENVNFGEETDKEKIRKIWSEHDKTIGGCKSVRDDFNDAYNSSIKFEDYKHEENRKRMKRRMDGGSR